MRQYSHLAALLLVLIAFRASPASASQTFRCSSGEALCLMFHFGSEGFSDVLVFEGQEPFIPYERRDFAVFEVKNASGEEDQAKDEMHLKRSKTSKTHPAVTIDICGMKGTVTFKGRRYDFSCEWDD